MLLILLTLILRPVGFKYRSKIQNKAWRSIWDWVLCLAGIIASFTFGITVGNAIQGISFYFTPELRLIDTGTLEALLNTFALLCGLLSLAMMMQGSDFLSIKTEKELQRRALITARITPLLVILLFTISSVWVIYSVKGYVVTSGINPAEFSNPLMKAVEPQKEAWLTNFINYPILWLALLSGFAGAFFAFIFICHFPRLSFVGSSLSIFGIISTVGLTMFPFLLPSSSHPQSSLLIWDSFICQPIIAPNYANYDINFYTDYFNLHNRCLSHITRQSHRRVS